MKRLLLILLLAAAQLAFAGSKLSPDLPTSGGTQVIDVIVQFIHPPTKDDLKLLGPYGQIKKQFSIIQGVHLSLSLSDILALQNNPVIKYVTPVRPLQRTLDITTQAVYANLAWQFGWDGTGVGIAVIDSGIAPKPDLNSKNGLASRIVYSQSFVTSQTAPDDYGHGTHVAGIIGSNGASSTGPAFSRTFKGVAPNANLIDLRVLDANGGGNDSDVISAIQTAISLQSTYNIRVMNLSLGRPVFESYTVDPICQAVEAAWKAGIVVVTAAGNYGRDNSLGTKGYGTIASPGNDPYVITVGATNTHGTAGTFDDSMASYSSKGPTAIDHIVKPDIIAPGNGVVSLLASTNCTLYTSAQTHVNNQYYLTQGPSGVSSSYLRLSGTSMATPVVSGAVAILLQKTPSLNPDQVKARLMKSAAKIMPAYTTGIDSSTLVAFYGQSDIFSTGAGYLDISAALANTDLVTLPAESPTAVFDSSTRNVTIVRNFSITWGDSIVWGDTTVYGSVMFSGKIQTGTLAGHSVLWGASSAVWGADDGLGLGSGDPGSIVWGDTTLNMAMLLQGMSDGGGDQ